MLAFAADGFATRLAPPPLGLGLAADALFFEDDAAAPPEEVGLLMDADRDWPDGLDEDEVLTLLAVCCAASCCRW